MKHVKILEFIGEDCITPEDGERIYELVFHELTANQHVVLDFQGVNVFASPFFNVAIGRLLKDFRREDLNRLLVVSNMSSEGMTVLKLVIKNSVEYYSNANYQQAHSDVLNEKAEE